MKQIIWHIVDYFAWLFSSSNFNNEPEPLLFRWMIGGLAFVFLAVTFPVWGPLWLTGKLLGYWCGYDWNRWR